MQIRHLLIILTLLFIACKKDKLSLGGPPADTPNFTPFTFICDTLPQAPIGGWLDSTINESHNLRFWAYNTASKSEIIYLDYYDRLYSYNLETKKRIYLDFDIQYHPDINAYGEVSYNKLNSSATIVNTDGSNSNNLMESIKAENPRWDYTGTFVYYKKRGKCIKASKTGLRVDSANFDMTATAFSKTSDNYLINHNNSIYLKDIYNNTETFLFTETNGMINPTFSKDDSYLFWWDYYTRHLHRFNMITKKRDTLLTSCENYFVTSLHISPNSDLLTMVCTRFKQGSPTKLFREHIPIEYDLRTYKWRELHMKF